MIVAVTSRTAEDTAVLVTCGTRNEKRSIERPSLSIFRPMGGLRLAEYIPNGRVAGQGA
jgi:hypothetical protein